MGSAPTTSGCSPSVLSDFTILRVTQCIFPLPVHVGGHPRIDIQGIQGDVHEQCHHMALHTQLSHI